MPEATDMGDAILHGVMICSAEIDVYWLSYACDAEVISRPLEDGLLLGLLRLIDSLDDVLSVL
jgi:hypothetical protein